MDNPCAPFPGLTESRSPRAFRIFRLAPLLALLLPLAAPGGGLPEPDLVLYGVVHDVNGGLDVRLTAGQLTWIFQPVGGGAAFPVTVALTNVNEQFSYVLRVPCDTSVAGSAAPAGTLTLGRVFDRSVVSVDNHTATFLQSGQQSLTLSGTDRGRIERVDLQVSIGGSQSLPDNWQLQYFGRTGVDPLADPDGDGLDNLGEYRAGTNPTDPASRFAVEVFDDIGGGAHLVWSSVAGIVYTLQRSRDLLSGFQDLAGNIQPTPPRNQYYDPVPAGGRPYFYRLVATRVAP